jgi:hypothetical protein
VGFRVPITTWAQQGTDALLSARQRSETVKETGHENNAHGFMVILWAGALFHGDPKDFLDGGDPVQQLLNAVLAQRQHIHFQRSFFNHV